MSLEKKRDVIVVGAGLAGAAAALSLSKSGLNVTIMEARARIGGREFLKAFKGANNSAPLLEYGGSWITPWHARIRTLVEECGLSLRPRPAVTNRLWLRDGSLHSDSAVAREHLPAHERALARVAADAILVKMGGDVDEKKRPLTGLSFKSYLDRLDPPKATRNLVSAWWTVSGNGNHASVDASEFLGSCAYGGGLAEAMIDCWADTVNPGMAVLAERMIDESSAELQIEKQVARVVQSNESVRLHTSDGQELEAAFCVMALGVNQLPYVNFEPSLSTSKQATIGRGHEGCSFKLWIMAKGVTLGTLVTGNSSGIEFAFAERLADNGATMIICFGLDCDTAEPANPQWVESEIRKLFPNAEIIGYDWHDWVKDPFALGTWVAVPEGNRAAFRSENWMPEGRIVFATSDFARENAGWFEGAVIAGEDAATYILSRHHERCAS